MAISLKQLPLSRTNWGRVLAQGRSIVLTFGGRRGESAGL